MVLPGGLETPDTLAGLNSSTPADSQFAKRFAENGYIALIPYLIPRQNFSGSISLYATDDRQFLFSIGYQVGRQLIGDEVLKVLSCVDYLLRLKVVDPTRIGIFGSGQGGSTALLAAALDERLRAAAILDGLEAADPFTKIVVNTSRWESPSFMMPVDQTVWGIEKEFTRAEIAALIAPRHLITASGDDAARTVLALYRKRGLEKHMEQLPRSGENIIPFPEVVKAFNRQFLPEKVKRVDNPPSRIAISQSEVDRMRNQQFREFEQGYSTLAADSYQERKKRWSRLDYSSVEKYQLSTEMKRDSYFDFVGRYPKPAGPLRAWSKRIPEYETASFSGYHLSVAVYPGLTAYGILLLPKGLKDGEKRPIVFTQHGSEGGPKYAIGLTDASQDHYYKKFGKRLAERGYVVFAPMICTQDKRRFELAQKAGLLGGTVAGLELVKMGRVIDFLTTMHSVDSSKIAFYGLSWGGFTSLWVTPGEPRFTSVITSGHFNDWTVKTTNVHLSTSYMRHSGSFDFYIFNILNYFDHSDLASLIAPRPYAIEIGDEDGVNVRPYSLIETEMKTVASIYDALGLRNRFEKEEFHGPHTIDGQRSFLFLDRWLSRNWN